MILFLWIELCTNFRKSLNRGRAPLFYGDLDTETSRVERYNLLHGLRYATLCVHVEDGFDEALSNQWIPHLPDGQWPALNEGLDAVIFVLEE